MAPTLHNFSGVSWDLADICSRNNFHRIFIMHRQPWLIFSALKVLLDSTDCPIAPSLMTAKGTLTSMTLSSNQLYKHRVFFLPNEHAMIPQIQQMKSCPHDLWLGNHMNGNRLSFNKIWELFMCCTTKILKWTWARPLEWFTRIP